MKQASILLMVILAVDLVLSLLSFYQVRLGMASPLIPEEVVSNATRPYVIRALLLSTALVPCVILFFRSKYRLTIVVCIAVIVLNLSIQAMRAGTG